MNLETKLSRLGRVAAPASLYGEVMAEVGIGDRYAPFEAPIGRVFIAWNRNGVSAVMRADSAELFERWFARSMSRPLRPAASLPERVRSGLAAQLDGPGRPRVSFDLSGLTDFERAVLAKTLEIPRGEVRTYSWIAREIGRPAAVRAVGTALANNPIPVLIPCHRVVRSDGIIGEYGAGGPVAKRAILTHEGVSLPELERLARAGVRYKGSRTTHIFCVPTCRHARRVMDKHEVEFRNESEARLAGYRPCKVCRPAAAA